MGFKRVFVCYKMRMQDISEEGKTAKFLFKISRLFSNQPVGLYFNSSQCLNYVFCIFGEYIHVLHYSKKVQNSNQSGQCQQNNKTSYIQSLGKQSLGYVHSCK